MLWNECKREKEEKDEKEENIFSYAMENKMINQEELKCLMDIVKDGVGPPHINLTLLKKLHKRLNLPWFMSLTFHTNSMCEYGDWTQYIIDECDTGDV